MGTKKTDSITHIQNQEEWDKIMKFNGLLVADIYQDWNGPCRPVISLFNKLYAQIANDSIKFSQVKVDNIRSLQPYKGKSEPTFLFLGGGQLVGVVRGVNAPIISELCLLKLDEEMRVIKGEIERNVIRDPGIKRLESATYALAEDLFDFFSEELTFAIVKPDVLAKGLLDEVIERLKDEGFDIIRKEIRLLSKEEVMHLYGDLQKQDYVDEIITYMTTGKSCILALSFDLQNAIAKLREITGPVDVEKAKRTEPESLRAVFGLSAYRNGIHSADSREEALKSISTMFPDLVLRKDTDNSDMDRTIIVIPINCYNDHMKIIMEHIIEADLKIIDSTETLLPKVDIHHLYRDIIIEKDIMNERVEEMYGSKFAVHCIQCKNCVNIAKYILYLFTPSLEETYDYKKITISETEQVDLIYASSDRQTAIRDINFFFPIEQTFAMIKPDAYEQRDEIIKLIKSAGFTIPIAEDMVLSVEQVEEIYKNVKNMPFYPEHVKNMMSGSSLVMVLSKHNAIMDWREHMGCVNPEEASEQGPDKLRGIFGSTSIENALHGASNVADSLRCIKLIFGNVQFDERGNVCAHKSQNLTELFPVKLYLPANIEEARISDILKKLSHGKSVKLQKREKELSLAQLSKLYSTIKSFESYPNLKCFIVIGGSVIPVIQHEESTAFEKLDKINSAPKSQKNFDLRKDLWSYKFREQIVTAETKYTIYKFDYEEVKEQNESEKSFIVLD